jgi:uncharacterized protein (TIGR02996 family)
MTTEAELLRAVLSEPESDSPRIAFADWLEEQGEAERAEFIRVQCELEAYPADFDMIAGESFRQRCQDGRHWLHCPDQSRCDTLRRRDRELLLRYGFDWLPKIGIKPMLHDGGDAEGVNFEICTGTEKGSGIQCDFRRGFVNAVTCTAADFLEHADSLCWSPRQTEEIIERGRGCKQCRGRGSMLFAEMAPCNLSWLELESMPTEATYSIAEKPCQQCRIIRRQPRPCPETAQPIRAVTLTTWPDMSQVSPDWKHYRTCREALSARWEGITFHLPGESV